MEDKDFGAISERTNGEWEGFTFQLWGHSSIQVMIDADENGPSETQRAFVKGLQSDSTGIRQRIEMAIAQEARKQISQVSDLQISSIYFPGEPAHQTWRIWYNVAGDNHYSYGVEITGDSPQSFKED